MGREQPGVMDCLMARAALDRIKEDPVGRFDDVRDFIMRRGWAALCYSSWESCRKGELLPKETGKKTAKLIIANEVKSESAVSPVTKKQRAPIHRTHEEYVELAKVLAAQNGGLVPCSVELRARNEYGLYKDMKVRYPDRYKALGLEMEYKGTPSQRRPKRSKKGQA